MSRISSFLLTIIERFTKTQHSVIIVAAIITGIIAGFAAVGMRLMIHLISDTVFAGNGSFLEAVSRAPWYLVLFIPALGGALVGPITYIFAREAKGHGVPEVMQSLIVKGGIIRARVAVVKALTSSITIGTGGSVGREGPIIQVGASVGSAVGQFFRMSNRRLKTLVGCGAAAGIAAAFNTPVAGALFAAEIILRNFSFYQLSPIVIASVTATVVSHTIMGNYPEFEVPQFAMASYYELFLYFGLALLCAVVAYLFIKILYFSEDFFDEKIKIPIYLKPVLGGLIIGAIGLVFPRILGAGYESIDQALHGDIFWKLALVLLALKLVATPLTLGSGGSGVVFFPSLFLGAMAGAFFGGIVNIIFPGMVSPASAYALVAMGGVVAATTHAPITAIIIVFELTHDYKIILPIMITCMVSVLIVTKFQRESIYTLRLVRRGIKLKEGTDHNVLRSVLVRSVYKSRFISLCVYDKFQDIIDIFIEANQPIIPVLSDGRLKGIISINDIKSHFNKVQNLAGVMVADDIADRDYKTVTLDDNCDTVVEIMRKEKVEGVAVVSADDSSKLLGMIWREDILDVYNTEVRSLEMTGTIADIMTSNNEEEMQVMEKYSIAQIHVPLEFVGKTIRELNVQQNYGIIVLLVFKSDSHKKRRMPEADYCFSKDDMAIIAGDSEFIKRVRDL